MSQNELTNEERRRWHKLYVAGWRVKRTTWAAGWMVFDNRGMQRSSRQPTRWQAVAEVITR